MTESYDLAGRTLMVGLPGPELDPATSRRIQQLGPGGLILFRRNFGSPAQVVRLLDESRTLLPYPLLLALDQEGGRVSRLEPWVGATPTAARLAAAGLETTFEFARATGRAIRALGFNLNFAPVVDLCDGAAPNGIADRSFGTDAAVVGRLAGAFLAGLAAAGVAGCLKHFPGLGPTSVDSHAALPTVTRSLPELTCRDLVPFRGLAAQAPAVMVGHGLYPDLDPQHPATLSPAIVGGLLRGELGYSGLVVSDDLEMGAVSGLDQAGSVALQSMAAGCDLLLYCADLARAERAREALARRASADGGSRRRLAQAVAAIERLATDWPAAAGQVALWEGASNRLREVTA